MTLYLDDFSITGSVDELVEFVKQYKAKTTFAGNIGDSYYVHTIGDVAGPDTFPLRMDGFDGLYEGHPINSMTNVELKEAIRMLLSNIDINCNLDDFNRDELIALLTTYASKNLGYLQNNK